MVRTALSPAEVDEVWRRWRSGQAVRVLAREMRRSPSTVRALILRTGGIGPVPRRRWELASDAAFAALCGVSPVEASSGKSLRHRLNRGGNRHANSALYRIALTRLRHDPRTRAYLDRRTAEGKTRREAIRCLKRYLVREIYTLLQQPETPVTHPPTTG